MSDTVEGRGAIDVRVVYRGGWFLAGSTSWAWQVPGKPLGAIVLRARFGSQPPIQLAWTGLHYGGERPWWVCPGCRHRFAILYRGANDYRCRRCLKLTYETQLREPTWRLQLKAERLHKRLGSDYYGDAELTRPRYMHHRKFERLRQRAEEASAASWAAGMQQMARMLKRAGG